MSKFKGQVNVKCQSSNGEYLAFSDLDFIWYLDFVI